MERETKRARLLDMIQGAGDEIVIESYSIVFADGRGQEAEPDADYCGPIRVPCEEWRKFVEAEREYYKAIGEAPPEGVSYIFTYGHRTHLEAVEDARREFAAAPALVRHEDNLFYMHGEGKPGRPTIIGELISEIVQ